MNTIHLAKVTDSEDRTMNLFLFKLLARKLVNCQVSDKKTSRTRLAKF